VFLTYSELFARISSGNHPINTFVLFKAAPSNVNNRNFNDQICEHLYKALSLSRWILITTFSSYAVYVAKMKLGNGK
jgi:hypothetical protein